METIKKSGYFKLEIVGRDIWAIDGPSNDLMHLVIGRERAMLIDTGMGIGDLAAAVKIITSLPLVVINTHGHPDHAGGNSGFEEVWLPPEDEPIRRVMCTDEYRLNDVKALVGEQDPGYQKLVEGVVRSKPFQIRHLLPGQVIDLGDRQFEVIRIPGHTPGSIGLLNTGEKLLFAGDSLVATPVWLYLKHSLPLKIYRDALIRLDERKNDFDTIFPGHRPTPLSLETLSDLIACADEILAEPGIGEPTRTFAGEGLCWVHGKSRIIYNPDNLA